jgi:hypothetical protein
MTHRAHPLLLTVATLSFISPAGCVTPVGDGFGDGSFDAAVWADDGSADADAEGVRLGWSDRTASGAVETVGATPEAVDTTVTAGGESVATPEEGTVAARVEDPAAATPTEVGIVEEEGFVDVVGLPALSRDGRVVAMTTYDEYAGNRQVSFMRAQNGHTIRRIVLDTASGELVPDATDALHRAFDGGRFVPLLPLEEIWDDYDDTGYGVTFLGADLDVRQERNRIVVSDVDGHTLGTTRVRRRRPDGPGRNLMAPELVSVPMLAHVHAAFVSPDGRHVVSFLSACDCACDIVPYALATSVRR